MRLAQRLLPLAAAAALGGAALVTSAAPAQAAACSTTNGVTVVVQSAAGTSVRCASGDPASAWAALQSVGHALTPVQRFPDAVCRIDGYPASDACINMPPASAYWSFWHAPSGGSWTYSQIGIKGWNPKPGSSVGFRFGSGSKPSVAPATVSAPAPTTAAPKPTTAAPRPTSTPRRTTTAPRSTTSTRGTTAPSTTTRSSTSAPSAPGRPVASSPGSPTAPATLPPSSAAPSPSTSATPSTTTTEASSPTPEATPTDVVAAPQRQDTGTSGTGRLVGGGALLAGLAAAVATVAVRRRTLG